MEIIVKEKALEEILSFKHFYIVGGYIRDYILNIASKDIDLAYEGDISVLHKDMASHFKLENISFFPEYLSFSFKYKDLKFNITSARKESYTPKFVCTPCTILEDLSRRDFSMNAIAYDPTNKKILDPFDGIADISNRKIRRVASFSEDPSRIIRAIKFKIRLNFEIEEQTKQEMLKELSKISTNYRVQKELVSLLNLMHN